MKQEGNNLEFLGNIEPKKIKIVEFSEAVLYAFYRLENLNTLAVLSLRGNGIIVPPKDALASLQSLQELRLDENNITVVGKDAFGSMRVISRLGLSQNQVIESCY